MKAVGYVRQAEGERLSPNLALQEQKSLIKQLCELKGWELSNVYEDNGAGGADLFRPGLQELIASVKGGELDVVIVQRVDRLSTNQKDVLYLINDVFQSNGVDIASVSEPFDTTEAVGKAALGMVDTLARLDAGQSAEIVRVGRNVPDRFAAEGGRGLPLPAGVDPEAFQIFICDAIQKVHRPPILGWKALIPAALIFLVIAAGLGWTVNNLVSDFQETFDQRLADVEKAADVKSEIREVESRIGVKLTDINKAIEESDASQRAALLATLKEMRSEVENAAAEQGSNDSAGLLEQIGNLFKKINEDKPENSVKENPVEGQSLIPFNSQKQVDIPLEPISVRSRFRTESEYSQFIRGEMATLGTDCQDCPLPEIEYVSVEEERAVAEYYGERDVLYDIPKKGRAVFVNSFDPVSYKKVRRYPDPGHLTYAERQKDRVATGYASARQDAIATICRELKLDGVPKRLRYVALLPRFEDEYISFKQRLALHSLNMIDDASGVVKMTARYAKTNFGYILLITSVELSDGRVIPVRDRELDTIAK